MKTISYVELRLLISETGEQDGAIKFLDTYVSFPPTEPQSIDFHNILSTLAEILMASAENWKHESKAGL